MGIGDDGYVNIFSRKNLVSLTSLIVYLCENLANRCEMKSEVELKRVTFETGKEGVPFWSFGTTRFYIGKV